MRLLQLRERTTLENVALNSTELTAIQSLGLRMAIEPAPGYASQYDLTPGPVVGVVQIGELVLEISPKIPIDRALFLLTWSGEEEKFAGMPVGLAADRGIVDVIAWMLGRRLRMALRTGLLQDYRTSQDALDVVRGRLLVHRQVALRGGLLLPLEVKHDEFTEDILPNRLLKAAIDALLYVPSVSKSARASLAPWYGSFSRVTLQRFDPRRVPDPRLNRLADHYRPALVLARHVLRGRSPEARIGGLPCYSILFDMERVFEGFVCRALRHALRLSEREFPRGCRGYPLYLDRGCEVRLRPDLSWWQDRRCVFVGDVKYKQTKATGILHPDLYQLLAYAIATGLPEGLLLYAAGPEAPVEHDVYRADKTLRVRTVDLRGQPDEILATVDRLADEIRCALGRHP